jgi:hypothetical protein
MQGVSVLGKKIRLSFSGRIRHSEGIHHSGVRGVLRSTQRLLRRATRHSGVRRIPKGWRDSPQPLAAQLLWGVCPGPAETLVLYWLGPRGKGGGDERGSPVRERSCHAERFVLYCRRTSASTAACTSRRVCRRPCRALHPQPRTPQRERALH